MHVEHTENTPRNGIFAEARDLGLRTSLGCPYAGMNMTLHQGELVALRGRASSGKTALLLTLSGRMEHTEGELTVLGQALPKGRALVQRRVGLGLIDGLNDVSATATVRAAAAAEFSARGVSAKSADIDEFLSRWNLEDSALVRAGELSRERLVYLGIALACVGKEVAGIAIDDIEGRLAHTQTMRLMDTLTSLAHDEGLTVMVTCTERSLAALADSVYDLS